MNPTTEQLEALQEVINIGVGQAAGVLNEVLSSHIHLEIPYITLLTPDAVKKVLEEKMGRDDFSAVQLHFTGSLSGNAELLFPTDSASKLVDLLTDEDASVPDMDSLKIGVLTEVGNIVISGVMGTISNLLHQDLDYLLPLYMEGKAEDMLDYKEINSQYQMLMAQAHFSTEQMNIQGDILLVFNIGSFDCLLQAIANLYGIE